MPFNTLSYFLFLPIVFLVHYFSPDRFRWLVLLVASFCFYAALKAPHLIAVLLLITTTTYFTGIWIDRNDNPRIKRYFLWGGISANVVTLIILKYLPFITQNLSIFLNKMLIGTSVPVSKTIIAIGVSYFIFQAISYLIDIYLEIEKPEYHFGHFALYMSFFPKLLQGPIERGGDLLPQFKIPYVFNYDNVRSGLLLFALGLLKKVVIADRLAIMINPVFDNVHAYKGFPLLLATYYYSLQIYFDFSGYTDMALGAAMMFNIKLTQNFNNPYFATSIADFWRRWHISFSRWILDYIFKPLQMSWRNWGNWGIALALMITFTISGIWHGASWGFVIWGALHGTYMAGSVFYNKYSKIVHKKLRLNPKSEGYKSFCIIIVFNLVSIAWLFFRFENIEQPIYVITNALVNFDAIKLDLTFNTGIVNLSTIIIAIIILCVSRYTVKLGSMLRLSYYTLVVSLIFLFGFVASKDFIYFRF